MNKRICGIALAAAAMTVSAFADFTIDVDPNAKPIKDMRKTANGVAMGVNGAMESWLSNIDGNDDILFASNRIETARVFRQAGMRVLRLQRMNNWWNARNCGSRRPPLTPGTAPARRCRMPLECGAKIRQSRYCH